MAGWSEYFQKLPNIPGDIEPEVLENIQQRIVNNVLDAKPTMDEMVRAIRGLKDGKTPGGDGIPAEVWKYGGANLSNRLTAPMDHQNMGGRPCTIRSECGNYRDISLLSAAGRIFDRIILNRLSSNIIPEVVPEMQCGFYSNRSTVDMIFCRRQLQEKCIEQD